MNFNLGLFQSLSDDDKALKKALQNIIGFKPNFMPYYVTALTHRSAKSDAKFNNERLEFLGDAFIGSIVGEYLFKKYPTQDEGYLTEMRSKIVSRQSLNSVALKMGLQKIVRYNNQDKVLKRSHIFGNAFEALVGAIYLDKGYATTSKFIKNKLIGTYLDIDELEITEFNFKNKLYTWAQKNHYQMVFHLVSEKFEAGRKVFKVEILVNDQHLIASTGFSKKEASQFAAQKALEMIENNAVPNFAPIVVEEPLISTEDVVTTSEPDQSNDSEDNTAQISTTANNNQEEVQQEEIDLSEAEITTTKSLPSNSEEETKDTDTTEENLS